MRALWHPAGQAPSMQGPWHLWLRAQSKQDLWRPAGLAPSMRGLWRPVDQGLWRPGLWRLWPRRTLRLRRHLWHRQTLRPLWHRLTLRPRRHPWHQQSLQPRWHQRTRRLWHLWRRRTLRPRRLLWRRQSLRHRWHRPNRWHLWPGRSCPCGTGGPLSALRACGASCRPGWARSSCGAASAKSWNDR